MDIKGTIIKKTILVLAIFSLTLLPFEEKVYSTKSGAEDIFSGSCTSIMVGRLASTDGSTITSHTCDGSYRNWVQIVPGRKHAEGTKKSIYTGYHWTEFPESTKSPVAASPPFRCGT